MDKFMQNLERGSWSVATTVRAPAYQVNEFLEHYVGLGADKVYLFFDDKEFCTYDVARFAGKVISFVCDDRYWETVHCAPPLNDRVGRPAAVERRQGVNALFAREIMHSEWLLHVDVDEFIYVKKPVSEVLAVYPDNVFSVLLRTLEAVYEEVKLPGEETQTVYFKKAVHQSELLKKLYPDELLKCATNGLWGTVIGKSFVRKHPEIKSMSVHWPTPVDQTLITNVPTYYIDLLHFEGQSYELFKEKFMLRVYKKVAKHMPYTYTVRLELCKREYDARGEAGLLDVYRRFYVMPPDMLIQALELGVVVKLEWALGKVSEYKLLINNPIFDSGARLSNWGGTLLKSFHNTYVVYDAGDRRVKSATAVDVLNRGHIHPVEIEVLGTKARLFVRFHGDILQLVWHEGQLQAVESAQQPAVDVLQVRENIFLSFQGKYLSVSPNREVTADRGRASTWESFTMKEVYPQIA
jgi:hypothetical protein